MKKEVVLAIITGFIIGLLITFGIYTARTSLEKNQSPDTTVSAQPTGNFQTSSPTGLTITKPQNHTLVDTDTVQLHGATFPNATITLITTLKNQIITANGDGDFTTDLELEGGLNQILITSYDQTASDSAQTQLNITYSTANI